MAYNVLDWSIDRSTGNIRYIGDDHGGASPSYASVIEFHREIQDLADDLVSVGDDQLDITDTNPSARSTDNIITLLGSYNIDDNASEHLYDGSITQSSGDTIYAGFVNFGNSASIQIIQNGAIIADDWWNSNGGLNSTTGISHRFILKTRDGGADIDNKKIIGTSRTYGQTYSEFVITSAGTGNNVLALSESTDLNNATAIGTVAGYTGITNTSEGYVGIDIDNNGANEFYYSEWDVNTPTNSINDFYERSKWLTRDGSAETLYGLSAEVFRGITHEIDIDTPTGSFVEPESLSWNTGTGQLLAIDSVNAGTKMYIQLLTGLAPLDNVVITGGTSGATVAVNITVLERPLKFPFVGASTGSALIGSYGLGLQTNDVTQNDKFFDLSNNPITPPNNVTFSVGGLVIGEDTVQVAPWDGVSTDSSGNPAIDVDQLSLSGNLTTANVNSIVVAEVIPSDTPASGYIRLVDNNGFARRLSYSSYSVSTFTLNETSGQEDFDVVGATSGANVWITYIDKVSTATTESFSSVYLADRSLVVIVRDGGASPIKEFISSASLTNAGGSITAIRTTDL